MSIRDQDPVQLSWILGTLAVWVWVLVWTTWTSFQEKKEGWETHQVYQEQVFYEERMEWSPYHWTDILQTESLPGQEAPWILMDIKDGGIELMIKTTKEKALAILDQLFTNQDWPFELNQLAWAAEQDRMVLTVYICPRPKVEDS